MQYVNFGRRLAAAGCTLLFAVSGGAYAEDEIRRVTGMDFDAVVLVGGSKVEVEVRQGPTCEIELRGDRDDLDKEPFYVSSDRLVLGKSRRGNGRIEDPLRFRVALPELRELRVKGSGQAFLREFEVVDGSGDATEISVDGSGDIRIFAFRGPELHLDVRGSGDMRAAEITVEELEALVSGSGDLFAKRLESDRAELVVKGSGDLRLTEGGAVRILEVSVIGSGDAILEDLAADEAEVNVIGSGSVIVGEIRNTLSAKVLGSGDVRYSGDPEVDETSLGSGDIRRRR